MQTLQVFVSLRDSYFFSCLMFCWDWPQVWALSRLLTWFYEILCSDWSVQCNTALWLVDSAVKLTWFSCNWLRQTLCSAMEMLWIWWIQWKFNWQALSKNSFLNPSPCKLEFIQNCTLFANIVPRPLLWPLQLHHDKWDTVFAFREYFNFHKRLNWKLLDGTKISRFYSHSWFIDPPSNTVQTVLVSIVKYFKRGRMWILSMMFNICGLHP